MATATGIWFPLWARLGLVFGGLVGAFIAVTGLRGFQADLDRETALRQKELVGMAATLAAGIDGSEHASFSSSADMDRPEYKRLAETLRISRVANQLRWIGTTARDEQGRYHYVVDGGDPPPYPVGFPIFDGSEVRHRVYEGESVFHPRLEDEWGMWTVAMAPIHDGDDVVGIVEVMEDADYLDLYARTRARRLALQIGVSILLSFILAGWFARYLGRHLRGLTAVALDVAAGNLDREVEVRSRDEIGALAGAFNQMVRGLRERELIRDTFGRYVSQDVAAEVLSGDLKLGGERREVTVLMSDLRGFTAWTEGRPPEEVVGLLNRYLAAMTEVILDHGGNLSEILGDGLVVLFGAPTAHPDDPLRAVKCAVAMQRALAVFNRAEGQRLQMGIGIATGFVIAGNIGGARRMKYGVVGATINRAARVEGLTLGNQVLVDDETCRRVDGLECGEAVEVQVKGMAEPLVAWPVRSVGEGPTVPDESTSEKAVLVELSAVCRAVRGKRVDGEERSARVLLLTRSILLLSTTWEPSARDQFKLRIALEEGALEEVYGRVVTAHPQQDGSFEVELRVTSMSPEDEARLVALLAS